MSLPKPAHLCSIPSIHDNTSLECRIFKPASSSNGLEHVKAAAVVAHPYAPLGGSMNDGVVSLVAAEMLSKGFTVCLFNFRGAGRSTGRTSWSGKPELSDYISVTLFLVQYLSYLRYSSAPSNHSALLKIVLGGYSYGSLIASHLPPAEQILASVSDIDQNSAVQRLYDVAQSLVPKRSHISSGDGPVMHPPIRWFYLLISPLLPPVTNALTLFSGSTFRGSSSQDFPNLVNCPSLAVFGDKDTFTSKTKLRQWAQKLSQDSSGKFEYKEFRGGHFWNEIDASIGLQEALRDWLDSIND